VMIKKVKTPELWYADKIGWQYRVRSLNDERYKILGEEMMQILKEDCLVENETSFTKENCCECEHFETCKASEDSDLQPMKCFRGDKFEKVQRG